MNPGELRHKITIQQLLASQYTLGQPSGEWADVVNAWVSIDSSSKQYYTAKTIQIEMTHLIKMRYNSRIKSGMRIKFNNRIFEILGSPVNYQERNVELRLMCKELVVNE